MSQVLLLEYACTEAERKEADELNTRQQVGGGSKWRTTVIFGLILLAGLLAFHFMIQREVPAAYRPYAYAAFIAVWLFFVIQQSRSRKAASISSKVEISERDLTIITEDSRVTMPWPAFSQCLESPNLFVLVDRGKATLLILPKRAFPEEPSQSWFRSAFANRTRPAAAPAVPAPDASQSGFGTSVVLKFRLGFRDYLSRTMASARTWAMILFTVALLGGISIYSAAHAPPRAVYSPAQVFFIFTVPILVVVQAILILFITFQHWQAHAAYLGPQEWALAEESITFASRDGSGTLPWTAYTCYKETRWNFIVWNPVGSAWMLFPKRAFASADEVRLGHALLARHLRPSRWFFG